MKQTKLWAALALATVLLAACGGQTATKTEPAQPAAQVEAPQKAAPAPAQAAAPTEAPGAAKTVAKPLFIDFYAPW